MAYVCAGNRLATLGSSTYYHNDPYFVCLWYSGMRIGELAGIYPENIVTDVQIPYFNLVHQENRLKNDDQSGKFLSTLLVCRMLSGFICLKPNDQAKARQNFRRTRAT